MDGPAFARSVQDARQPVPYRAAPPAPRVATGRGTAAAACTRGAPQPGSGVQAPGVQCLGWHEVREGP